MIQELKEGRNRIFYIVPTRVSISSAHLPALTGGVLAFCMSVKRVDMNNSTPTITACHLSTGHQNIPRVSSVKTVDS
jgi:hypothetical protein